MPLPDHDPARYPKNAWTLCWLMFFATALSFLDRQVLSVLAPSLMVELGMNNSDYAHVVSAFTFSYMVMFSAGGWLVDKLGMRLGLALCITVWSVASGAHGFASSALGLIIGRLFLGFGEGGCFPASTKGSCEWFPPAKRTLAIGIANGGAAFGAVVAPPLTVWVAMRFGWRGAFFSTGLIGLSWTLAWWLATSPRVSTAAPAKPAAPAVAIARVPWRLLLADSRVWRILGARFFFDPVFYFYMFWIPKYLADERGFSLKQIGDYTWIPFLALGLSSLVSGRFSDLLRRGPPGRKTRAFPLVLAAFVTPVSGLVVLAPSAGWAITLMAVLMAAHGLWITSYLADIGDQFPSSVIATLVGLSGTVGGIAATIANLGTGAVVDAYGFSPIFILTSVLYPVAATILLVGRKSPAANA